MRQGAGSGTCSHRHEGQVGLSTTAARRAPGRGADGPSCLPQGQFLCLAIRDGKLVLYYDFSTGLEMAKPSSNSSSLTISSTTNKAVRGNGRLPGSLGGLLIQRVLRAPGPLFLVEESCKKFFE